MADVVLNDAEISNLIRERKEFPTNYESLFQTKAKRGHKEQELTSRKDDGSLFKIMLRQSRQNILDFSVILGYVPPNSTQIFRLRRYNGKSHEHTNKIEKEVFDDFHIHMATERYQQAGFKEDKYAQVTDAYSEIHGAMDCLIEDCNIVLPGSNQLRLL